MLNSYSKLKKIRENTVTILYLLGEKSICKWTCAVQFRVNQGSTVVAFIMNIIVVLLLQVSDTLPLKQRYLYRQKLFYLLCLKSNSTLQNLFATYAETRLLKEIGFCDTLS